MRMIDNDGTQEHYIVDLGDGTWMDLGAANVVVLDDKAYDELVDGGDYHDDLEPLATVAVSTLVGWIEEGNGESLVDIMGQT